MGAFAVIDTETNWNDRVMSIGAVVADEDSFAVLDSRYYVLAPEYLAGGMFEGELFSDSTPPTAVCSRAQALMELKNWLLSFGVTDLFAYNAPFDRNHLPEYAGFAWYDIIRMAAYRKTNPKIPACADCYSTGRLKRNYGVEPILRLLSGKSSYFETHNAVNDAKDELEIMRLLAIAPKEYVKL